ncbi:helix-turn-helix transcriptional regulator [Micromonospora sp. STR1s_5]|nr:helix-turn-helix transcriptional regulator [Micromonospora sp. STR1s_5]
MMRYGQFCPIAKAAEIVAERWTPLVVHELLAGSTRFNEIRRGVPLMSQTLLSQRLKELERVGIVERRGDNPRRLEWHLTSAGRALGPVIQNLGEWGLRFAQDPLEEDDLDVMVLMWNIRRRVDPNVFAGRRVTVAFEFTDVPQNKRHWWVVNDRGEVDLCPIDPGYPVDYRLTTDIRTMIQIWFARLSLEAALRADRLEVEGPKGAPTQLRSWFLLSPINMATLSKRSESSTKALQSPA